MMPLRAAPFECGSILHSSLRIKLQQNEECQALDILFEMDMIDQAIDLVDEDTYNLGAPRIGRNHS